MNRGMFPAVSVPSPVAFRPGGRLTLVQNSPVISSDQAGKTVLFYTPAEYGAFPVIKNGVLSPVYFNDDLILTLTSAFVANGIYDIFGVDDGLGRGKIIAGAAWSVATAGAGDRGSTVGSTELIRVAGMRVNRWGMPGLNAQGATYIAPTSGVYLGSIFIDGSAGQLTCHTSFGQSRKWGVWNAFNRSQVFLKCGDPTASWATAPATWRQSRADTGNKVTIFTGLADERFGLDFCQRVKNNTLGSQAVSNIGIGFNSTTSPSGKIGYSEEDTNAGSTINQSGDMVAMFNAVPALGINNINMIEQATAGSTNNTFFGTETNILLSASWMA